jgi:hypothetical protein
MPVPASRDVSVVSFMSRERWVEQWPERGQGKNFKRKGIDLDRDYLLSLAWA